MVNWHGALRPRRAAPSVALVMLLLAGLSAGHTSRQHAVVERWRIGEPGRGEPAVNSRAAFFLSRRHDLVAAELASGRVLWRAPLGASDDRASGVKLVATEDVVVSGTDGLEGFDAASGIRRWVFQTTAAYGFGFYLGERERGTVFTGSASGHLAAFDVLSGESRWMVRIGSDASTIFAPVVCGAWVAVAFREWRQPGESGIAVVDKVTGQEQWRRLLAGDEGNDEGPRVGDGPICAGSRVVVTGDDGSVQAFDVGVGRLVWRVAGKGARPDHLAIAGVGDTLITGSLSGEVSALDADTGGERWRRTPVRASVAFALSAVGDVVFVPYLSGDMVGLSRDSGEERWRIGGSAWGFRWPPHAVEARFYLAGSSSGLFAFEERGGRGRDEG